MSEKLYVKINRDEMEWLQKRSKGELRRIEKIKQDYSAVSNLPPEKALIVQKAYEDYQSILDTKNQLTHMLENGERRRLQILKDREEQEWIIECAEEESVKEAAKKRLEEMLKEEEYVLDLTRESLKNLIDMVYAASENLRTVTIPEYEKSAEDQFQAPITKSFVLNNARWMKDMLQQLQKKLEKKL
jgi:hypothetical protein